MIGGARLFLDVATQGSGFIAGTKRPELHVFKKCFLEELSMPPWGNTWSDMVHLVRTFYLSTRPAKKHAEKTTKLL